MIYWDLTKDNEQISDKIGSNEIYIKNKPENYVTDMRFFTNYTKEHDRYLKFQKNQNKHVTEI